MSRSTLRRFSIVAAALAAALALSACQPITIDTSDEPTETVTLPPLSEIAPLEDPTAYVGPTTALVGGPNIDPLSPAPEQQLPVTVISYEATGPKEVTITDASRVIAISLSGSLAEIVHAFGLSHLLVGRDISTAVPGTEDLPVVTRGGHSIDAEGILALNPSVIITDGTIGPADVVLQIADAGVPVVMVERPIDAESSYLTMQQIADVLGVGEAAPDLIERLRSAIADKEAEVARLLPSDETKVPRVAFLYVRGTAGVFYLFGEGSGVDSLIRSIGAIDAAAEIGWVGERPMTEEALVGMNPDIILVMTDGLESAGGVDGLLAAQQSIALTNAGKNRRIIDIADSTLFAGGTRIPDIIDGLARAIYAPESLENLN